MRRLLLAAIALLGAIIHPALAGSRNSTVLKDLEKSVRSGLKDDQQPIATLRHDKLVVTLSEETGNGPDSCDPAASFTCKAAVIRGQFDGRPAFISYELSNGTTAGDLELKRLDPGTKLPQVVFHYWTGGAHCCNGFTILTADDLGQWHVIDAGAGEGGEFIDVAHDGVFEFVRYDNDFKYQFSSYVSSVLPTRILRLQEAQLVDVTGEPRYRAFLLERLKQLEIEFSRVLEKNGFLAGWVAQKSLLGQAKEAWHSMLTLYDREAAEPVACRVDERVFVAAKFSARKECPPGESYVVPFPEALATFLTAHGYLTPEESKDLGIDIAQITERREKEKVMATAAYERQMKTGWWGLDEGSDCVVQHAPSDVVVTDQEHGLIDKVDVLKSNEAGKAVVALVTQLTQPPTARFFFRGFSECEAYLKRRQKDLEKLK